jgi:hypothetical protein
MLGVAGRCTGDASPNHSAQADAQAHASTQVNVKLAAATAALAAAIELTARERGRRDRYGQLAGAEN